MSNARYSGAPAQFTFGDAGKRGVLLVDTDRPDKAELVPVPGVVPLVTMTEVPQDPEDWPKDAIIRLAASPEDIATASLPENVVRTKPVIKEQAPIEPVEIDEKLLDGLPELLAEKGLNDDAQRDAIAEIESILKGL